MTKSGLMLGLGETRDEIVATLRDLRRVGCDLLTMGQLLTGKDGSLGRKKKRARVGDWIDRVILPHENLTIGIARVVHIAERSLGDNVLVVVHFHGVAGIVLWIVHHFPTNSTNHIVFFKAALSKDTTSPGSVMAITR